MGKVILLIGIIFSTHLLAKDLGSEFLTAKSYIDGFRATLLSKITQMDQNFIKNVNNMQIIYTSRENTVCIDNTKVQKNQPLMRIEYEQELKQAHYIEIRRYYGCNGLVVFQEVINADGVVNDLHTKEDLLSNKLNLDKVRDFDYFNYSFIDDQSENVLMISSQKDEKLEEMDFFINNQPLMKRTISNSEWVSYISFPTHFKMNRNGYRFESKSSARFITPLRARITKNNTEYYDPNGVRISLVDFQNFFTLNGLNFIMESFLAYYPKTTFVTSNLQSSKLLSELRDAQTFLINGVQLNLVRNLIDSYIDAVQKGEIVDNRKK